MMKPFNSLWLSVNSNNSAPWLAASLVPTPPITQEKLCTRWKRDCRHLFTRQHQNVQSGTTEASLKSLLIQVNLHACLCSAVNSSSHFHFASHFRVSVNVFIHGGFRWMSRKDFGVFYLFHTCNWGVLQPQGSSLKESIHIKHRTHKCFTGVWV